MEAAARVVAAARLREWNMKSSTKLLLGAGAVALYMASRRAPTMSGLSGDGNIEIAPGATMNGDFTNGKPGVYEVGVVCRRVNLGESQRTRLSPSAWTSVFRARGMENVKVTRIQSAGIENAQYRNSAFGLIKDITGLQIGKENPNDVLADIKLKFTVEIAPALKKASSSRAAEVAAEQGAPVFYQDVLGNVSGMGDLGLGPIAAGVAIGLAIIALIGIGLATYDAFKSTSYAATYAKKIADFIGGVIGGTAKNATQPVVWATTLPLLAAAAGLVWIIGKSKFKAGPTGVSGG